MNQLLLASGVLVGIFGLLLILAPRALIRIERFTDRIVEKDPKLLSRRWVWGVLLVLAGIHMIYVWLSR